MVAHELLIGGRVSAARAFHELLVVGWPVLHRLRYARRALRVPSHEAIFSRGGAEPPRPQTRMSSTMPPHRVVLSAAALALAAAPPAAAKDIERIRVCGADKCTNVRPSRTVESRLFDDAFAAVPRRRAPYFRITIAFGDGRGHIIHNSRLYFVPSLQLVSQDGAWTRARGARLELFRRLTRGHRPYPARTLPL